MARPQDERRNTNFNMGGLMASSPHVDQTSITEIMYIRILTEWASSRFKWVDMPPEIDIRFLEQQLFYNSFALFYRDNRYNKYMAVRAALHGPLNVYDNPVAFRTVSNALYKGIPLTDKNSVPIWGSYTRMPARDIVLSYAKKLADIDNTLTLNSKAMRHNKFVKASESQRLTFSNVIRQMDEGAPYVYVKDGFDLTQIEVLDLGIDPLNLSALRSEKNQIWNEAMTLLGITNANQDKKERLVAAEATGSDGGVLEARKSAIKPRLEACDQINAMFGLNISIEWDDDQLPDDPEPNSIDEPDDDPDSEPKEKED